MNENQQTEQLLSFAEEFGVIYESFGVPRMSGRILGWLLVCTPTHQSAGQLAEMLRASKGSISSATRILIQSGMIKKTKFPGDRKTYYVIPAGIWADIIRMRDRFTTVFRKLAEQGLELLADQPPETRERLAEMHHIHAFFERERPKLVEQWLAAWEEERKQFE